MERNMPNTPFSTRLSGSAKEIELRIRSIFQWKKKRPPVIALIAAVLVVVLCGSLIGFTSTAQNGLLGQVYQEYFERNPSERITIAYENKENPGYPLLTVSDSSFEAALQYLQVMELRTARGKNRYIGDFDSRDGAIILNSAGGQQLKIEMYPSAECLVISEGETAKVYRWDEWAKAFDIGSFLELWKDDSIPALLRAEGMSEIGKTYNQLRLENPDLQNQFADEINARAFCLGRVGDTLQYYFFGTQDGPSLEQLAPKYGNQLKCAGIMSTVENIYPEMAEGVPLEQFFIDNQITDYDYFLEDGPGRGWVVFEDNGYRVMIDTNESGVDYYEFEPAQTMRHSYPIFVIDSAILTDNLAIQDQERGEALEAEDYLATQSVLKNLSWENTYGLSTGGAADYEMAMTGEIMELFGSVADRLTSVDKPDKFSTILGGVTLWLSKDKGERISFYPGEQYPDVLVYYVTDKVKEYASVEDITLYSFLVAAVEKKYVELHDLDDDESFETVQWDSKNNKRFLVIYDVYDGQIQHVSVNDVLGCSASEYSGQMGNIKGEYNNLIVADMEEGTSLYRYDGSGQFSFVCTLEEAIRT